MQPVEIVGCHGLFEPSHVVVGEALRPQQCLFAVVGPVRLDQQFRRISDGRPGSGDPAGIGGGITSHFHLDAGDSGLNPAG